MILNTHAASILQFLVFQMLHLIGLTVHFVTAPKGKFSDNTMSFIDEAVFLLMPSTPIGQLEYSYGKIAAILLMVGVNIAIFAILALIARRAAASISMIAIVYFLTIIVLYLYSNVGDHFFSGNYFRILAFFLVALLYGCAFVVCFLLSDRHIS